MYSVLRLFRALPIKRHGEVRIRDEVMEETVKHGFIFSPEVMNDYPESDLLKLTEFLGLNAEQMNSSFHKSWKKVKDADIEQLVIEQILHYITTYGFEALGIYHKDSVYIPNEELKIPDLKIDEIRLVVIKGYTKAEIKEKLIALLDTGIALKEETAKDVVDIATWVKLKESEIEAIRNKEVKVMLYELLDKFPENPVEFLRYIVYRSTSKALLIKNPATIQAIKANQNLSALNLLDKYEDKHGLERLAEIFYRFKPLFLAFKTNSGLKQIVNRIRKLAIKYHKPMREDLLNEVTAYIKTGRKLDIRLLKEELKRVSIFRSIRLAYALKYRTTNADSIMYRIRNGKGYSTEFSFDHVDEANDVLDIVVAHVVSRLKKKLEGKKIFIPEYIKYALPATEKQFTGYFPSGTCITIPNDMIFGIHWKNVKGHRIDLDLSVVDSGIKIGWDGDYRSDSRDILFSGDITDPPAKKGATELFYVGRGDDPKSLIVCLNYYNHEENVEVPFKILVAEEKPERFGENYTVDPNNVIAITEDKVSPGEIFKILGLVDIHKDETSFYFASATIGQSISSRSTEHIEQSKRYLHSFYTNMISLNEILEKAGVILVDAGVECDVDLSPESLEKDTIINLLF